MGDTTEIIDAEACAAMLDCTVDRVEDMARSGDLPGVKIGRSWRFVRADLVAWLAAKGRAEAEARKSRRTTPEPLKPRRAVPPSLPAIRAV